MRTVVVSRSATTRQSERVERTAAAPSPLLWPTDAQSTLPSTTSLQSRAGASSMHTSRRQAHLSIQSHSLSSARPSSAATSRSPLSSTAPSAVASSTTAGFFFG